MHYTLTPLPYAFDAFEPYIDARTMAIHHTCHHAMYVDRLNDAVAGCGEMAEWPLEEILRDIRQVPEAMRQTIRNYGGAHLNHGLFWRSVHPRGGGEPVGPLARAITSTFGSYRKFTHRFTRVAEARFGSGWAWLAADYSGRLEVLSTPNEDSPLMLAYQPILGLDLWEHAYYLTYAHRRNDYIAAWWHIVSWPRASADYTRLLERVRLAE